VFQNQIEALPVVLNYAIAFLLIALLAGILGFGVVAGTGASIAKVLFVIFLVLFIASLFRAKKI
jgi:uncharacterized membrane protein YtjA (UPF0391 family)